MTHGHLSGTDGGRNGPRDADRAVDFFISYSPADERWATWIAWQLEAAGHRTLMQAWDFVPGTNFIDFMDRGVRDAAVVVAVLSRNYLTSRYGRMEWQAALRTDPGKLVTVRVEDCPLEGLLATITYLDLLDIPNADAAREALLLRLRHVLAGRAKPSRAPAFPRPGGGFAPADPVAVPANGHGDGHDAAPARARRTPATPPAYPPTSPPTPQRRDSITLLHVPGPRFGRGLTAEGEPATARDLQARIWANVTTLIDAGVPSPDLVLVSGDVMESARPRELTEALTFLTGLRVLLGLEPHRLILAPGRTDVSRAACQAYFLRCEVRDVQPQEPYFPKLEHYVTLFDELYQGLDGPQFDIGQPWTLFAVPELRVAVAALNSTMAASHRPEDDYGWIGEAQATWFAERLRPFEESGWLRIGVLRHDPAPGDTPAGADPRLLRDAATLDRLVSRHLHVLLHGPGPGGQRIDFLGSDLPVLPAAGPGRDEIIQIGPDGLRRFSAHAPVPGDPTETLTRTWTGIGGTFPALAADAPAALVGGTAEPTAPEPAEPEPAADPHTRLLDRIAEVCATRHPTAKIRRVTSSPPHLLITRQEEGFTPQWRVGAHVGELTTQAVDAFLGNDPDYGSELIYQGPPPSAALREEALRRGVRLRSFTDFQGLLDLDDYLGRQTLRLRDDPRYPPDEYVPQRFRELDRGDDTIRDDLAAALVRLVTGDAGRFVLLLGDFGRGKSFALREVTRRISETAPHLIPILVELRTLDRAHSLDGLVAAHLANHGEDVIDLKAFHYMLREGRIVLLFDGFDELVSRVTYERAADHLDTLLQAAQDKAKIIVASRTQHFRSDAQVFTALGERVGLLPHRRILRVEDFTPAQIRRYLINRYDGDERAAGDRLRLIGGIQDLLGLARNPRMLSFIAELDEQRLRAAARARNTISAAALYREILRSWLAYEEERGSATGLTFDELWQAVTTLAVRLWETGEETVGAAELAEVVQTLSGLAGGRLSTQQAAHAVGSGSLVVRDGDGQFGFIHGSVAEWLLANMIAEQLNAGAPAPGPLIARPLSQLTIDFLGDLADTRACQAWAEAVLTDPDAPDAARANAIKLSRRLRTPPATDLRGASLPGEDLSYRELAEVDLTGADLTGARLVGTNLTGAVLRDTRLVDARLDEAQLRGADLTGADLTRARLARADLTGTTVTGSRWNRAAVVAATGVPDAPELRRAAVAPGRDVETEFAPAAVGVRHGFHAEFGRLPHVLDYSPDGGTLAIGSDDGGVLICDTATGLPLRTLQAHRGRVFAVTYGTVRQSPDGIGDVLVTGASDGTVRVWDAVTGTLRHVLDGHTSWPWPVLIGPSGGLLATGDASGVLRLWNLADGTLRHELPAPDRGFIFSLACHGSLVAVSYSDGTVLLWDGATASVRYELTGAAGAVYRVAFSPAGHLLATGGQDGAVRLWDPTSGDRLADLRGHTGGVYTLAFHPTEPLLATGDTGGDVRIWDTTGEQRHRLAGHLATIYGVAFDPSGTMLATGDSAGEVRLWDPATGRLTRTLTGHTGSVWPFVFRPDGGQLAISDDQFTTRLWDPRTGHCRHTLTGHGRQVTSVRFSATGTTLASSGNDGVVRLWDPATGRLTRTLTGPQQRLITLDAAVFSPTAPRLATVGNDGRLNLLNLETDRYERHLKVESAPVWAVAFSPSGDELATANDDDTVRVWYRTTGRLIHTLGEHRGRVRSIAFTPDGSMIATGCDDSAVRLWDATTGELLRTLRGHTDRVYSVSFGNGMLASASWDTTARIWDVRTGETRHELRRHTGRLWTAAFGPAGDVLATAGDDLVIRLWEPTSGRHLHTLTGHTRGVWSVRFSPSGELLASGGDDGTVRLWSLAAEAPATRAVLLGLPEGWAALAPDGRYKLDGDVAGQFWHVIDMCRFEAGELDPYLPAVRRLAPDVPF